MRKLYLIGSLFIAVLIASILVLPSMRLAASIGTGIGLEKIQTKIDTLHDLGKNNELSRKKLIFLKDLYRVLAIGARATMMLPASSQLMFHYLEGSGSALVINPNVFAKSDKVIQQKLLLVEKLCSGSNIARSQLFDMGGTSPPDSAFALYFGTLSAQKLEKKVAFSAEMPWKWPTYATIQSRYGSYDREIFPIPNLLSLAGKLIQYDLAPSLYLPNALGGELERYGLAKSFNVSANWTEPLTCDQN